MSLSNFNHIINNIIENVEDEIDRVSFVFTCKRLYDERQNFCNCFESISLLRAQVEQHHQQSHKYRSTRTNSRKVQEKSNRTFNISPISGELVYQESQELEMALQSIPPNKTRLAIYGRFEAELLPSIPRWITSLKLNNYLGLIEPGVLPPQLIKLDLGIGFNQTIRPQMFPDTLQSLKLAIHSYQILTQGSLPPNLKKLSLGSYSTSKIKPNVLPKSVVSLTLPNNSTQTPRTKWLPPNLEYLYLSTSFKKKIKEKHMLPLSIKQLHFPKSGRFNFDLDLSRFENMTHLSLPCNYDHTLVLPPNLTQTKTFYHKHYTILIFNHL